MHFFNFLLLSFLFRGSVSFPLLQIRKQQCRNNPHQHLATYFISTPRLYNDIIGTHVPMHKWYHQRQRTSMVLVFSAGQHIDNLLSENKLKEVLCELNNRPAQDVNITKERFLEIFRVIEDQTKAVNDLTSNERMRQGYYYPPTSQARIDMTSMYKTLRSLGHLQVFGAAVSLSHDSSSTTNTTNNLNLPVQGSKIVTPFLLENITSLPLSALTPKPSNNLVLAGSILSLVEILFSLWTGIDFNILILSTVALFLLDKILVSGANMETLLRWIYPDSSRKIIQHEAGHFLLAYLLACPVEGIVLSTWAALKDVRFGGGSSPSLFRSVVSAGTSFFDPELSDEMNRPVPSIRRTSIDRYSIIVMGGIAAESMIHGHAEGGAGDEAALISFISNLYQNGRMDSNGISMANIEFTKNQARFGVLQAVLLLREYRPCYDALVDTLERGRGSLGDCVYAIEQAAKVHSLAKRSEPIGFIDTDGHFENFKTN